MREMQVKLFTLLSVVALIVSCDTTEPSFDETIPEVYSLTTQVIPEDGGTIQPAGGDFEVNERVDIQAYPSEGYVFERWEGDMTGNTNPESVVIDDDKNITARFSRRDYPLNITISGEGKVTEVIESRSSGNESNQGLGPKDANSKIQINGNSPQVNAVDTENYKQSEITGSHNSGSVSVKLQAVPEEGWYFDQWEGDLTGDVNPEVITIDEEKNVTAVFLQEDTEGFSINVNVIGQGEVNKNPDRTYFNEGDEVTLTANPDQGWSFIEWQGDLTGSENSKSMIIEESLDITALFEETDDPAMMITQQPSGTIAGTAISPAPEVRFTDGLGVPIQGAEISVTLNNNSFSEESSEMVLTDQEGVATFDNLIIETAFSDYILTFGANEADVSDISSNPFGVVASAGDPSNSSATVSDGVAGKETVISISVRDSYDNVVTEIENKIEVNISGANKESPPVSETNTPGEYTVSYIPENTGIDEVAIQLDGTPISGSPFESNVVSSGADASNSTATVPEGTAGEETQITIIIRDQFGNSVGDVAEDLSVEVSGSNSASPSVSESNAPGEYIASYTPENSGTDHITIQLSGTPIGGSPFESDVASAGADASNITATVPDGTAGEETEISIIVRDRFGNLVSNAAGDLSVDVSGANSATPPVSESSTPGEYTASYTPETSGTDQISIRLGGDQIDESPFVSNIFAASVDPSISVVSAEPNVLTAGEVSTVTLEVRDSFSNLIGGLSPNDIEITYTGDASVSSINETSTSGIYDFEITSTKSGEVGLSVSANGTTLNDTPTLTFEPGDPETLVIITQPENTRFFQPIGGPPAVLVRDEFDNAIPGVDVSVSEERGADFLEGSLTVVTNQSGVATFNNLVLNRIGGNFRLVFSVEGADDVVSDRFQITIIEP